MKEMMVCFWVNNSNSLLHIVTVSLLILPFYFENHVRFPTFPIPNCFKINILGGDYEYAAQDETEAALGLPADSRSIRDNLVDVFECDGRPYGMLGNINDNA